MTIAYLNGQYLPLDEARVPVLDRGYLFGDGVYEVIPSYAGSAFRLEQHLARLDKSLEGIRLHNPLEKRAWQTLIQTLIRLNDAQSRDQAIYLQISRGVTATRAHGLPDNPTPTVLAFLLPFSGVSKKIGTEGVSAITTEDIRWLRCDIKAIALLANVMLADGAQRNGHNEAILHRDSKVTEGASSNVFAIIGGEIVTAPKNELILNGITREFVIELIGQTGLPFVERVFTLDELRAADEIWLSSSTREIFPVTTVDSQPVGTGIPGSHWRKIYNLYQQHKHH